MELKKIIAENFASIIGVSGTMGGVILGSLLNTISKKGRLKIFQNEIQYSLTKRDNFGGFESMKEINSETKHLYISLDFHIYNSSGNRKIMRNIHFFAKFKNKSFHKNLLDTATTKNIQGIIQTDSFHLLNINPKELIQKKLKISFSENFEEILNSEWYLIYKNSRNKTKKTKIDKSKLKLSK